MMSEIIKDPWLAALIILFSQITFIFLRTINVIYTAERRMVPAILSGAGVGFAWLISMTIGLNSIMGGAWQPILSFLIGGAIGTYWGIKKEEKKHGNV